MVIGSPAFTSVGVHPARLIHSVLYISMDQCCIAPLSFLASKCKRLCGLVHSRLVTVPLSGTTSGSSTATHPAGAKTGRATFNHTAPTPTTQTMFLLAEPSFADPSAGHPSFTARALFLRSLYFFIVGIDL